MSEPEADGMFVLVMSEIGSEVAILHQTQVRGVLCVWPHGHKYSLIAPNQILH
jgi:hypothetical protein